ncbi:YgaP family membrane protein [Aridibaculum aurantiacum]|uniref:YgaP family membrane protein n=1 Tax=Aridibaculum aurantiacum TaxID=2810307 RepID=UPI001A969873|nr:DUF2892 domain-containing protein [Aridibaculum aurantiacum]
MENMLPDTDITLEHSTPVEKSIQHNLNEYYQQQEAIERRLLELDNEWDLERVLFLLSSSVTIPSLLLSLKQSQKWLILPAILSGAMLSHAITNWCPPTPLLKRMGFRSRVEIEKERYALKALRGDFRDMLDVPNSVWNAVNK